MLNFRHLKATNPGGQSVKLTIASGPVIIENGKVLLDKHGADNFWKFPGGSLAENLSLAENAQREAKSELGIAVELQGKPLVLAFEARQEGKREYFILVHYRAKRLSKKIKPGKYVRAWAWHNIAHLPSDCAPNIAPVLKYFREK